MLELCIIPLNSSTKIDCTLSSESTGQECLENVCQRLSINQPEFFGLRYEVKGSTTGEMRWVDLDRPISRQLEKYSANTKVLYLRVMYYVLSGVSLISDESTRNYYFLQLKNDVVEGRISCDPKQAVILANYSRQAEYGNHQDRHTVEYLKDLLSFPRELVDAGLLETLTEQVIHQAYELHNVTQGTAESLYISACQQLDGYGQETFAAKDDSGEDVTLGISVSGIIVASETNKFYPWRDIKNVLNHKKYFNIECSDQAENVRFTLADSTTGSYIWRLCALQHRFFAGFEQNQASTQASQLNLSLFQQQQDNLGDSRDDLLAEPQYVSGSGHQQQQQMALSSAGSMGQLGLIGNNWQSSTSVNNNNNNELPMVWSGGQGMMVESQPSPLMDSSQTNLGSMGNLNSTASAAAAVANHLANANANVLQSRSSLQTSTVDINLNSSATSVPLEYAQHHGSNWAINPVGSNASLINHRAQSSSCLDLSNNNNNLSADRERLKALLPTYRPAPDYETAIQQKSRKSSNDIRALSNGSILHHLSASQMLSVTDPTQLEYHQLHNITGSQPDVSYFNHAASFQQQQPTIHQQQPYPDVTHHTTTHMIGPHYSDASDYGLTHRFKLMRLVKAPAAYPANRLSSTSTPDLASHRVLLGYRGGAHVSGSSPDLVSTRPLHLMHHLASAQDGGSNQLFYAGVGGAGALHHSQGMVPHGTYENLNFMDSSAAVQSGATGAGAPTVQTVLPAGAGAGAGQGAPNLIYYVPREVDHHHHLLLAADQLATYSNGPLVGLKAAAQQQQLRHSSSQHNINGSIEPIYENVPLPWKNDNEPGSVVASEEIRNRTSSIQSAPGTGRYNSQATDDRVTIVQPSQHQQQQPQPQQQVTFSEPEKPVSLRLHQSRPSAPPRSHDKQNSFLASSVSSEGTTTTTTTSKAAVSTAAAAEPPGNRSAAPHLDSSTTSIGSNSLTTNIGQTKTVGHYQQTNNNHNSSMTSSSNASVTSTTNFHAAPLSSKNVHNDSGISSTTTASSSTHYGGGGASASLLNVSTSTTASSGSSSVKETKRRKIWEILGGGRSKSSSADKPKSATLGREKDRKNKGGTATPGGGGSRGASEGAGSTAGEENQLRHRWSTGMPRQPPLRANISKEELCSQLESKLADPQLYCEFERIPKRSESASYSCALADENKAKNFDPNFLPYDSNRVRLTPTADNRMGYVNASHITTTVGNKQRFYIVAESPNDAPTTNIFWQCVWEADVYLLVQLSNELNYIPHTSERCLEYGQYQVWREFSQATDRGTTSKLRVYHTQSRRYRSVWHISYNEWGDQNCPKDVGHFLGFLEELNSVRLASVAEVPPSHNTNPPVLIHCNEGGGRTGVTLVADLLLYTLDHNQDLDIPRLIGQIRHQRGNMIPSLAQYKFIHALLIHYLKQTRLI